MTAITTTAAATEIPMIPPLLNPFDFPPDPFLSLGLSGSSGIIPHQVLNALYPIEKFNFGEILNQKD